MCCSGLFFTVVEDFEDKSLSNANHIEFFAEVGDCLYIIRILSDLKILDLHVTAITSQYLSLAFR